VPTADSALQGLENVIRMTLSIESRRLIVSGLNVSLQEVRLWQLENSWGWNTLSLEVKSQRTNETLLIQRRAREWTRNGPWFLRVPPAAEWQWGLDLNDGWWRIPPQVAQVREDPLEVEVILRIPRTPEAEQLGVVIGLSATPMVIATPPHTWLFRDELR